MWNITLLWLFCCSVLSSPVLSCPGYTFFSQLRRDRTPGRILTVYGLNDASLPKDVPFRGFWWRPAILRGSNPQKPQKGAWLGIYQPNLQNHKTAISLTAKIGSTPDFDRVIELCGWSRMTTIKFKMADGRHIAKCWKCYNSPIPMDGFRQNLSGLIPSGPRHVYHDAVAMVTAVA